MGALPLKLPLAGCVNDIDAIEAAFERLGADRFAVRSSATIEDGPLGSLAGLFDTYRAFTPQPAALFALSVVRRPGPGWVTVHGGGWMASGVPGTDRLPVPVYPEGLRMTSTEGAGEVQTPLRGSDGLRVGDRVWFRHAKAGELAEHVDVLHIVEGRRVVDAVPTYRGDGKAFL